MIVDMESIFQTFSNVLLHPTQFFSELKVPKVGIQQPFRFALVFMTIKVFFLIAFFIFPQRIYPSLMFTRNAFAICFWMLLVGVLGSMIYLQLSAIFLHRICRFFSNIDSFPSAYSILAYNLAATGPFFIFFGLGYIYGLYLMIVGLRERYHLSIIESVLSWFLAFFLLNFVTSIFLIVTIMVMNMLRINIF